MFGIGWGELAVMFVLAILVFGPERLPRMIAQAASWLRVVREQASTARDDLVAAAAIDPAMTAEFRRSMSDLAELNPRRLAGSLLDFEGLAGGTATTGTAATAVASTANGAAANGAAANRVAPATAKPVLETNSYDEVT